MILVHARILKNAQTLAKFDVLENSFTPQNELFLAMCKVVLNIHCSVKNFLNPPVKNENQKPKIITE
jgi:hypothetical protein